MDSCKRLNQSVTDRLHSSAEVAVENEDMPSLDVLSFEHELCTSQNCQCRMEIGRRRTNVVTGLAPFSFRTESHPSLKRPLTNSSGSTATNYSFASERLVRMTMPPVFGAPVHASSLTNGVNDRPSADNRDVLGNTNVNLFGADHCGRASFHSFDQLNTRGSPSGLGLPQSSSIAFHALQVQSPSLRSTVQNRLPARVSTELDLSDLQTVLEDSVEEPPADVASCPAHLVQSSPGLVRPCTCAQQAAKFDDWTVDELAGYFEDFCHIPKKMSAMAEMMYM